MTTVVPFVPVVFFGAVTLVSFFAASQWEGLLPWTTAYPTPCGYREEDDGGTGDDPLAAEAVLLGLALALLAQSFAGGRLVGLVVACTHDR